MINIDEIPIIPKTSNENSKIEGSPEGSGAPKYNFEEMIEKALQEGA